MSDAIKWALLVAGAVVLIGLILALPFVQYIDIEVFSESIEDIISVAGDYFEFARGGINYFLPSFGRRMLTGVLIYLFGKWAILMTIKITAWIYHFIFK